MSETESTKIKIFIWNSFNQKALELPQCGWGEEETGKDSHRGF